MARMHGTFADGRAAWPSRLAWAVPAVFLGTLLPARAAVAVSYGGTGLAGVAWSVVLFALPLLYTVPRGRDLWNRHPAALLTVQAVLTYLPFLVFGHRWVGGLAGLLAGLLLLTAPARVSFLLCGAVLAVEGVLRIGILGLYPGTDLSYVAWVFIVPLDIALPLFGLARLTDLVADLREARTELAAQAVVRERTEAAERLRAAVGDRLREVMLSVRASLDLLADAPDRARGHLSEAAATVRLAVERVRRIAAEDRYGRDAPVRSPLSGDTLAPRLALLVLALFTAAYSAQHVVNVVVAPASLPATLAGVAAIVTVVALQFHHSVAGSTGVRPRAWGLTLGAQAALPLLVVLVAYEARTAVTGMMAFPAGSALLLLPRRPAWVAFAACTASMGILWPLTDRWPGTIGNVVYLTTLTASTGLAVYGLSRLTDLARTLSATREELARKAVDHERLRVARDTHDLLGLGLSTIALKCDLAGRLIGLDDGRARAEIATVIGLEERVRTDIRTVTTGVRGLSLRTEVAAAREVLAWAGVPVDVVGDPPDALPHDVDEVLAIVLREAVTNLLRHSDASRCEVEVTADGGDITLSVTNDGVRATGRATRGRGLANLGARAEAVGGRLTTRASNGAFSLSVRVPSVVGPVMCKVHDDVVRKPSRGRAHATGSAAPADSTLDGEGRPSCR
jgi:two-component system sensor histidine kinase DesK